MKILLVAPQPFYQERGTPIAARLVAETLCNAGHRVDLLAYHEGADITLPGLRIFRARQPFGVRRVPIGISFQKLLCDVMLVFAMLGLLRKNRYDVVHAVEEAVFPAAMLKPLYRFKLVYDMDSSMADQLTDKWRVARPLRGMLVAVERFAVRRVNVVLAVCEDLAVKVRPWVGTERVALLPDVPMGDAVAASRAKSLRLPGAAASMLALYVGNLEAYQGIDLLLEGFALSGATGLTLVIIGGMAAHIAHYKQRAEKLGIDGRVEFLGPRPIDELGGYLQQADILVSPRTLGGNTPMKIYSYMQAGKPILATDIKSHTQVLDASCAELVAAEPISFGRGLERLVKDAARRERLGRAAHDKVEREFSLPVFQRRLLGAYELLATAPI